MKAPVILIFDNKYLALQYDPWFKSGGAAKQVVAWVEGLKAIGVNVVVLGAHSDPEFFKDRKDTEICYDPNKGIRKLRYFYIRIPGILRALARINPDYVYYGVPSPYAGLLAVCSRIFRKKFVLRVSNDIFVDGRASKRLDPVRKFFFHLGYRCSHSILCQNDYQFGRIRERYPKKAFRIANPYCGPIAETPVPFERRAGVAWVGIFQHQKNLPLLLQVAREMPEVCFEVAGGNDRPLGEEDQRAIDELRRLPNVRFAGFLDKEGVLKLLDQSCLLLNTSHYEGFSNTFLEAFSRGTPVFTLPQNDPNGIIRTGKLGRIFEDIEGLIWEIRSLLESRDAFAEISSNCLSYMRENHDLTVQVKDFLEIVTGKRQVGDPRLEPADEGEAAGESRFPGPGICKAAREPGKRTHSADAR